jgi:hypothetical protein
MAGRPKAPRHMLASCLAGDHAPDLSQRATIAFLIPDGLEKAALIVEQQNRGGVIHRIAAKV